MTDFDDVRVPDGPAIDMREFELGPKEMVCRTCFLIHPEGTECP